MEKLKSAFTNIRKEYDSRISRGNSHDLPTTSSTSLTGPGRIAWPPKLVSRPRVFGEVTDTSGRPYPRDFGRSIQLGGHTYYMFGDTFCFSSSHDFLGVTNNTIALIPDIANPTKSTWLTSEPKVPEFVPYSVEERKFGGRNAKAGENKRFVNWAFGGVVEIPGSRGREGWLFYDTVEVHDANAVKGYGIGLAKVTVISEKGEIQCERVGPFPLFPPEGPAWGNISNISAPDGWTYLFTGRDLDNYMARIRTDADFMDSKNYQFLKKGGVWAEEYDIGTLGPLGELEHTVLVGQAQGAILYLPEHGPQGKPYLWFGCEKFMTSQLWVGAAERPEGPWELHKMGEMPKISQQSKTRYCIYPHLWGSDPGKGEFLITWSDDGTMGGKVAAGTFAFSAI